MSNGESVSILYLAENLSGLNKCNHVSRGESVSIMCPSEGLLDLKVGTFVVPERAPQASSLKKRAVATELFVSSTR